VRLLADEGVDAAIVALLHGRVLLTADKDFGELVYRLRKVAFGVLLVRLPGLASARKANAVLESVREHGAEMAGAFSVVSPGLVRIRPPL
jgi:hypothetical protein